LLSTDEYLNFSIHHSESLKIISTIIYKKARKLAHQCCVLHY